MTAGELAIVLGTVLCALGFAALIVVLMRVLDTLRSLRGEVESSHRPAEGVATLHRIPEKRGGRVHG